MAALFWSRKHDNSSHTTLATSHQGLTVTPAPAQPRTSGLITYHDSYIPSSSYLATSLLPPTSIPADELSISRESIVPKQYQTIYYQLESLICDLGKAKQNIFPSCYQSRSVAWQFWSLKCWSQRGSPEYKDLGDNKILKFCHSLRQNDVNLIKGPGSRWYNVFFGVKYVFQIKGYVYNFWWRCWNVFELK